jgi:hypothetical protein
VAAPLAIGVCSWSLQVKNVPELKGFLDQLGIDVVQIACGDPHHASWDEGEQLPEMARRFPARVPGHLEGGCESVVCPGAPSRDIPQA